MDMTLSSEQEMIQRQAREFLEAECPISLVRQAESDEAGYSPDLYRKMAGLGWLGFALPSEYGGEDGGLLDLALVYEELGKSLVPGPHLTSSVLAGQLIAAAGSDAQKRELLPRIASGELIATVAQLEQDQDIGIEGITATARQDGDGYILDGRKLFVPHAGNADVIVVVARLDGSVSLFLVEPNSPGVSVRTIRTLAGDKPGVLTLSGARIAADRKLEGGWAELQKANGIATIMLCAEMVGGMQAALDMALDWAKTRVQFGRPIGAFQAIQHKAVAMVMELTGSRLLTYQTAWRLQEGLASPVDIALTKAKCNEAYRLVTFESHEVHGGTGWTSGYDLQLYFKRRTAAEQQFGNTDDLLAIVGDAVEAGRLPVPHRS